MLIKANQVINQKNNKNKTAAYTPLNNTHKKKLFYSIQYNNLQK